MSVVAPTLAEHFDALFARDADPWRCRTSWYEERKRATLLAALPRRRFVRAYEPGCAAGELTAALAARCDEVVATDASAAAVARARGRVASLANVRVDEAATPRDWPAGGFDLVVVSELGYYLDDDELSLLIERAVAALADDGVLVACHWRHPAVDLLRSGDRVHARFVAECGLARAVHHQEDDFVLDLWNRDASSVARREGLA